MTAFFTERFGRKRYLTFSIFLFIVASFLCGTATSLGELVLWRLLQGAGGAALLSTAQATLRQIFPARGAGHGAGDLPARHHRRADARPDARRLDHRQLPAGTGASSSTCRSASSSAFLVMTFLHDPPTAAPRADGGRLARHRPAHRRRRLAAVRARGRQHRRTGSRASCIVDSAIASAISLRRRCSGGSSRRATSIRSSSCACCSNRDLAASIFLFVVLGFGLYGGVIIFPLFTQSILGFSPTADRPGDDAGRHRDGGDGAGLRPAAERRAAAGRRARADPARAWR